MAELAYALGLGPSVARLEGSSPSVRITLKLLMVWRFLAHEIKVQTSDLKKRGKQNLEALRRFVWVQSDWTAKEINNEQETRRSEKENILAGKK